MFVRPIPRGGRKDLTAAIHEIVSPGKLLLLMHVLLLLFYVIIDLLLLGY